MGNDIVEQIVDEEGSLWDVDPGSDGKFTILRGGNESPQRIHEIIRAASNKRIDTESINEAFLNGTLNEAKRDRALQIVEKVWQKALEKYQVTK
jgi:hypothetical protein